MLSKAKACPLFACAMALLMALAALCLLTPDRETSALENRALAAWEAPSAHTVASGAFMRAAETYVDDQFFARDGFVALRALLDAALLRTERNGVLLGERLMEATQGVRERTALQNAQAMGEIAAACGVPATALIVPLSSQVYPECLPPFYPGADMDGLLARVNARTGLAAADALAALRAAQGETFYRTDHHWTAAGARAGYEALCALWEMPALPGGERAEYPGFAGSYFARAPSPLIKSETLTADLPRGVALSLGGGQKTGLIDPDAVKKRDKYAALLYGNAGRATLLGGGEDVLLVVKDSYANALLPTLAQHFARVEIVDLRYTMENVADICKEVGARRVLFLYGLTTLLTDRNLILQTV